jgi:hypothetical protein
VQRPGTAVTNLAHYEIGQYADGKTDGQECPPRALEGTPATSATAPKPATTTVSTPSTNANTARAPVPRSKTRTRRPSSVTTRPPVSASVRVSVGAFTYRSVHVGGTGRAQNRRVGRRVGCRHAHSAGGLDGHGSADVGFRRRASRAGRCDAAGLQNVVALRCLECEADVLLDEQNTQAAALRQFGDS